MHVLEPVIMTVICTMKVLKSMLLLMIRCTLWLAQWLCYALHRCLTIWFNDYHYLRKLVLQSTFSPLEMGACIAMVDASEAKKWSQIAFAVTSLFLSACDWHVPWDISYHNIILSLIHI